MRLKIPSLSVDTAVKPLGLTSTGAMDAPTGPNYVGWYMPGVRPGELGSAVMAGHFGWKKRVPAVFDKLHKLRPGDKIYVEDDKGESITFVVQGSRSYDAKADTTEVFTSQDGQAHLNLITCGGVLDKSSKSYTKRLVVFSNKQ